MKQSIESIKDGMKATLLNHGYICDRYGHYGKVIDGEKYRYKFGKMSYRFEKFIDTTPKSWLKLKGGRYKYIILKD